MDTAAIKRAARIRRDLLRLCDASKAAGGYKARWVYDILAAQPDGLESETELIGFAVDLESSGLITIKDTRRLQSERKGLDFQLYTITAKGTALLAGAIEKNPLVEDERI
jgi:hypothetical protein